MGYVPPPPPPDPDTVLLSTRGNIPPHMRDLNRPKPTNTSFNTVDYGGLPPLWWWFASFWISVDLFLVMAVIRLMIVGVPF